MHGILSRQYLYFARHKNPYGDAMIANGWKNDGIYEDNGWVASMMTMNKAMMPNTSHAISYQIIVFSSVIRTIQRNGRQIREIADDTGFAPSAMLYMTFIIACRKPASSPSLHYLIDNVGLKQKVYDAVPARSTGTGLSADRKMISALPLRQ